MTICTSCGREFEASSDAEHLCPQCAAQVTSPSPAEAPPSRFRQALESPTIILIALNTLIYLMMGIQGHKFLEFDGTLLVNWGANSGVLTPSGQWWRLVTSTF